MSLLGFNAIGKIALGQIPSSSYITLASAAGSYVEGGNAALFRVTVPTAGTTFAETGGAGAFAVKEGALVGAFSVTGSGNSFKIVEATAGTPFAFVGNIVTFSFNGVTPLFGGSYVVSGNAANVIILEAEAASSYLLTGYAAALTRDFVNWLPIVDPAATWNAEPAPSQTWTAEPTPSSPWTAEPKPSPTWAPVSPPSSTWTLDNAQFVPAPVTE